MSSSSSTALARWAFTLLLGIACLWFASCGRARSTEHGPDHADHATAHSATDSDAAAGGSASSAAETTDLDRPVEELFAVTCEHGTKAFECDECRYEVGVAKAPAAVREGGLIRTEAVERRRVEEPVELTGEVQFDETRVAHVSSQAEGIIRKVMVSLGSQVKRNQPLIEMESLSVGEAEGTYLEARAMLRLAQQNFDRVDALRKEGIASEKEFHIARQELEAAEIRVSSARGRLHRLGGGLPSSTARSGTGGRMVLRAPSDGMVLAMHAVPGEAARADESLLTVGENTTVWVWADVYERDVAKLAGRRGEPKLRASIRVRAYPDIVFPGVVDFMSPAMDETSRTAKVRIGVPNAEGRLLAGMFAKVQVFIPGTQEVLAVHRSAVLRDNGRAFVFVQHHGDYFVRRPVKEGRSWLDWVEVSSGLTAGQVIAGDGSFLLKSDVLRSKMGAGCAD